MIVFDSPKDGSIKEIIRRTDVETAPIGLEEVKNSHATFLATKRNQSKTTSTHA